VTSGGRKRSGLQKGEKGVEGYSIQRVDGGKSPGARTEQLIGGTRVDNTSGEIVYIQSEVCSNTRERQKTCTLEPYNANEKMSKGASPKKLKKLEAEMGGRIRYQRLTAPEELGGPRRTLGGENIHTKADNQ